MKHHWIRRSVKTTAILILSCGLLPDPLAAQGTGPDGARVREAGGKDTDGPVPRLPDGTPSLGRTEIGKGVWLPALVPNYSYEEILIDPQKSQGIPYQPWARALQQYRRNVALGAEAPHGFCIPRGGPQYLSGGGGHPMEFIQLPEQKRIIHVMEFPTHLWREIFLDGRPHPSKEDLEQFPTFVGHAVGHWEGDTLVVDTVGFNEGTWFGSNGEPHTNQTHLIERYTRTSLNNLHIEATIDDPGAYTRPWTVAVDLAWSPDSEIKEYICQGNNRWQEIYIRQTKGATGTGNAGADSGHGHPVKGSFVGEWGLNANMQDSLLVLMDWDGKTITGTINPGPQAVPITKAELNPDDWTLHIEGGTGAARVVLDGKFENLTWLGRSLAGTYTVLIRNLPSGVTSYGMNPTALVSNRGTGMPGSNVVGVVFTGTPIIFPSSAM